MAREAEILARWQRARKAFRSTAVTLRRTAAAADSAAGRSGSAAATGSAVSIFRPAHE